MEKFTKVVVDIEQLKNYKADIKINYSLIAANKLDATSKVAEDILSSKIPFEISITEDINTNKELSAEEVIKEEWNKKPNNIDSYEFYHLMRNENFDGAIIKSVIGVV